MGISPDARAIDERFRSRGLEPVGLYTRSTDPRECVCTTCGTTRFVRLSSLKKGETACLWCGGWRKWAPWAAAAREESRESTPPQCMAWWKTEWLGTKQAWTDQLLRAGLLPVTPVVDRYEPVGVVCARCGESFVVVPSRVFPDRPDLEGCPRCAAELKRAVKSSAEQLYEDSGLELLAPGGGLAGRRRARCVRCGTTRLVSYLELLNGTAPLCWTCTHGIRPDEPHRVYLFHFPRLHVMKVGLTHNRHNRRFEQHELEGGVFLASVVVTDRAAARALESEIRRSYEAWASPYVDTADFPQGGWTETWSDDAPPLDLGAEADRLGVRVGHE